LQQNTLSRSQPSTRSATTPSAAAAPAATRHSPCYVSPHGVTRNAATTALQVCARVLSRHQSQRAKHAALPTPDRLSGLFGCPQRGSSTPSRASRGVLRAAESLPPRRGSDRPSTTVASDALGMHYPRAAVAQPPQEHWSGTRVSRSLQGRGRRGGWRAGARVSRRRAERAAGRPRASCAGLALVQPIGPVAIDDRPAARDGAVSGAPRLD
jgi:hypothetical protein